MARVRVHWNLHLGGWSVLHNHAGLGWRVQDHAAEVRLADAEFRVSKAGRARALREGRRNVHAWFEGEVVSLRSMGDEGPPFAQCATANAMLVRYHHKEHGGLQVVDVDRGGWKPMPEGWPTTVAHLMPDGRVLVGTHLRSKKNQEGHQAPTGLGR